MNDRVKETGRIMREIKEKSKDVSLLSRTRKWWAQAGKRAAELVAQYQKELPELLAQAESGGPVAWGPKEEYAHFSNRLGGTLALIAATREYQFG